MVVNVKGNLKYSKYNDSIQTKKEINSVFLSKKEPQDYKATFTQTILIDKDAIGKLDKEKAIYPVTARVIDYTKMYGKKEVKCMIPFTKVFELEVNKEKPEQTKALVDKVLKVKKGITEMTVEGDIVEEEIQMSEELEDFINEAIEAGLSEEEILAAIDENFEFVSEEADKEAAMIVSKVLPRIASETGTEEELRLARTIQNLTKTKPLGHCIARAIQLLRTVPLQGEPGISNICKAKFFDQTTFSSSGVKTVTSRSGIPEPGATLDTSPGMAAAAQLFFDTIVAGSPKLVIGTQPGSGGQPSTTQQYIAFMRVMARLFGDDTSATGIPKTDEELKISGLKGIRNKRDRDLCKDGTGKEIVGEIVVPPKITGNVYDVVNQLYQTQVRHAAECGKLFKLLFNIQQDKSSGRFRISLSDNIIKKGFPEIERVNYLARETLIKYYSACEMKYLQGMKIVIDNKRKDDITTLPK
jgi:hypothetical protein